MSGVNWNLLSREVEGCKNIKEVEELMVKCKIDKDEWFRYVKMSVSGYSGSRDYREKRNVSLKDLREENRKLKGELGRK